MDAENPVVKLCTEGMKAEAEGKFADARNLFMQAWTVRQDDFDAAVAAHYVARCQDTLEGILHWNQEALRYADAVGDERTEGFYPSLYLNLGKSHEALGSIEMARHFYTLAKAKTNLLPSGEYGDVVRRGVASALRRTLPG